MSSSVAIEQQGSQLKLVFKGRLDRHTLSDLYAPLHVLKNIHDVSQLMVCLNEVTHFDTAGIFFLLDLKKILPKACVEYLTDNPRLKNSILNTQKTAPLQKVSEDEKRQRLATGVGLYTVSLLKDVYFNFVYAGELIYFVLLAFARPKTVRWKDVWRAMEEAGPNALPIIALLGFLIGLILSFQSSVQLQKFGATIFVINLVGIGMTREMSSLFTGILLAGRTSSAFAAEIGTMKVNEELDALKTIGLSSVRFLVLPRVIAVTLMLPFLSLFMTLFSFIGCGIFMMTQGYPWEIFFSHLKSSVRMSDVWIGLFKAVIFGVIVAAIGCANGIKTGDGASAVGRSTTRAVVSAIVTLVVIDGIFAVLFYSMGI